MADSVELATGYINIVASSQGLGEAISGDLGKAEGQADKAGEKSGGKFKAAFGLAVAGLAVGGAITKGLYEVGAQFDKVSDTIRVGTGATGANLGSLIDSAKLVGTSVPTSFDKASSVVADLNTRLGLSGKTLETVASQYIQAGNILGEDVDIQTTTAAFSAFGIEGDAVSGAMDQLFRVSQATGVSFNELASQAQAQAPALQALGFSFEDTTALLGSLDKAGLNSAAITASLGKGLVKLAKDGEEPQAAFQRVTAEIGTLVESGDKAAALDLAAGIFGTKGAVQFIAAVESGTLGVGDLTAAAGVTTDTILGVADETASLTENFQLLKNRGLIELEPISSRVFDGLSGLMKTAADNVTPLADSFYAFGGQLQDKFGPSLAKGVESAKPYLAKAGAGLAKTAEGAFATIGPAVSGVFAALAPVIGQVAGSLGPVIGQLAPLLGQVMPLLSPFSLIFKALLPVLPQIAAVLGQVVAVVADGLAQALTAAVPLLTTIADVFGQLAPFIGELIVNLLPPLLGIFDEMVPLITGVIGVIVPLVSQISDFLIPIINALLPVVKGVFGIIASTIGYVMGFIQGVISTITGIISTNWTNVWNGISSFFTGIFNGIKSFIGSVLGTISGIFTGAWDGIKSGVSAAFGLVKSYIIDPLTAAYDWVKNTFAGIGKFFSDLWQGIVDKAASIFGTIGGVVSNAFGAVGRIIKDAINFVIKGINNIVIAPINVVIGAANTASFGLLSIPKIPNIPLLAKGGVFDPRPGGQLAVVAENRQREIVTPEPLMRQVVADALAAMPMPSAWSSGQPIQITINEAYDPIAVANTVTRRLALLGAV